MSDLGPSIEDLMKKSKRNASTQQSDDDSATGKLSEKIDELRTKEQEELTEQQATASGLPYVNLVGFPISPEALSVLDEETARENKVVPFYRTTEEIRVASTDPTSPSSQAIADQIKEKVHVDTIMIYQITENSFNHAIKLYKALPKIKKIVKGVEISEADIKKFETEVRVLEDLQKMIKKADVSQIVTAIIALALQVKASDVHVEAEEKDVKVRYRVDGILNDAAELPKDVWSRITSRVKLLASLKLNVENKPQDGRFTIFLENDKVDVRVSTIPTNWGESIVMRLLRSSASGLAFDDLGIRGRSFEDLSTEVQKPNGMIITTGPTGSGKTTTLYSVLSKLNTEDTKIITLEDPVEYKLEGINQSQIDHSKGYTFAEGLRSILRQDPDVIMVGEIRDLETADVAINAALTGHLVVSTLHTNSAAAAIPRFLSMGVKPFLLSPALNAIIGQRLVRRICPDCKEKLELDTKQMTVVLEQLKAIPPESGYMLNENELAGITFYKGGGCEQCHGIGYKGRLGIYEVLIMTKEIEDLILSGKVSEYDIQQIAIKHGMITMVQDGLLKAMDGITTVEEIFRVAKTL